MRPIRERFAILANEWICMRARIYLDNGSCSNAGEAYGLAAQYLRYGGRAGGHRRLYYNWFRWRHPTTRDVIREW